MEEEKKNPFENNRIGEFVWSRTYARPGEKSFHDTVRRVCTGIQALSKGVPIEDMAQRMLDFKLLPPGRGLWAMGTPLVGRTPGALFNCGFVSTRPTEGRPVWYPYVWAMNGAMLGTGIGFDTEGVGLPIHKPTEPARTMRIPDSREGWCDATGALLASYMEEGRERVEFCYDDVRAAGEPIKGFGGTSAGPGPLRTLHSDLRGVLDAATVTTSRIIVDIMNMVGKCVVSGNVRRTAEIAFGRPDDAEFLDLKNYRIPEIAASRGGHAWTSNNSVFAHVGMDYAPFVERICDNGEPGFAWLENMRSYGRMADPPDNRDARAAGGNPCLEQTLESYELCCLVETFPAAHADFDDFARTLRLALLYGKVTAAQIPRDCPETAEVMRRNMRLGISMSGIVEFIAARSQAELIDWCNRGYALLREYDAVLSAALGVNRSIKLTSIKPSGTVSLLAGVSPGVHYPVARCYLRRVRIPTGSPLVAAIRRDWPDVAIEEDVTAPKKTAIVVFPMRVSTPGVRTEGEVSMLDKMALAVCMQRYWADNQVSATITFDRETEGPLIAGMLRDNERHLKGVSLLPRENHGYAQPPYEPISDEHYERLVAKRGGGGGRALNVSSSDAHEPGAEIAFCDGDQCELKR